MAPDARPAPDTLLAPDALRALAALAQSVRSSPPTPAAAPQPRGPDAAWLAQLLAMVLPHETEGLATVAVQRFGSVAAVLAAPERTLRQVPGLGTHAVAAIKLVHEAALRLVRAGLVARPVLANPAALMDYLVVAQARMPVEQVRVLFLDTDGLLLADEVQGAGTVNHTPVYPREVVRRALQLRAAGLVLVHNHPSGDPTPSAEDLVMTSAVVRAAAALGLVVRDHIIVGTRRTLSFRDAGLL